MQTLQSPPQRFVVRGSNTLPFTSRSESTLVGPFSAEEWAKLHQEDRWLARVLSVLALAVLGAALSVYGTIAVLAAVGRL